MDALVTLVEEGRSYVVLLPIFVALIAGERLAHALTSKRRWDERDGLTNIVITGAFLVFDLVIGWLLPVALMVLLYEHARLWTLGMGALGWLAAFLLHDLTWYTDHRLGHRVSLFWSVHQVHHSSNEYNMTVASRGFVLDNTLVTRPLFYLLPVLGVSPVQFVVIKIVTSIWGIAQHTRLVGRLGPLEWIFATPSNHRVHHGTEPAYIDKNYGEILIIWDRLLGTYQREAAEPTYGLTTPLRTYNPITIELAGLRWLWRRLRQARTLPEAARALLSPPEAPTRPSP